MYKVSLVKTGTEAFAQTFTAGAALFAKYQIAVHNDKADDCDMEQYLSFLVDSPLKVSLYSHSSGVVCYLHNNYYLQILIHYMCLYCMVSMHD